MAYRVLEVQPTPNPNAAKFVLDRQIAQDAMSYHSAASAAQDALARELFEIPGVSGLLLLNDFVTVNKAPDARWDDIIARVENVLSRVDGNELNKT